MSDRDCIHAQNALIDEQRLQIVALRSALKECADDLEKAVDAAWPSQWRKSPDNARKYQRDMAPVVLARALLEGKDR
jgi:hypothetical protein